MAVSVQPVAQKVLAVIVTVQPVAETVTVQSVTETILAVIVTVQPVTTVSAVKVEPVTESVQALTETALE